MQESAQANLSSERPEQDDCNVEICEGATREGVTDIEHGVLKASTIIVSCPIADLDKKVSVLDVDDWSSIRWLHFREGRSARWIAKQFGMSRKTVAKHLSEPDAPRYKLSQSRAKPVADQWRSRVNEIIEGDKDAPRKQRHTARRIFCRLVEEDGYKGSERTIRQLVADIKNKPAAKASIPLIFQPGLDAQVDFGESYADIAGQRVKLQGFEMRLSYSRKKFIQYFPSTDKEAFLAGHVQAFAYFCGVVTRISYDNLSAAVAHVRKGKQRVLTQEFKQLKGYYNFGANFCQPGEEGAHEKGGVESGIGFSRRNWMVPVPAFDSLEQLNHYIMQKCMEDEDRKVDGEEQTIGEAWQKEQPLLLALPARPFDPVVCHGGLVDNYCTVQLKNNHYSVPAQYAGRGLTIRAYWDHLQITDGLKIIAEHRRSYNKDEYVLNPEHYLDLLERRPNAVPYARPLVQYGWPEGYWELYQKMVERLGPGLAGRDFIRVLRSHVKYGGELVGNAVARALELGQTNADFIISTVDRQRMVSMTPPEAIDIGSHQQLACIRVTICPTPEQYHALIRKDGGVENDDECVTQGLSEAFALTSSSERI